MTFRIVFQEEAELEALDAAAHMSEKAGFDVGVRWLDGLMVSVNGLSNLPRRCPIVDAVTEFPDAEVRKLLYKSHRITFIIQDDIVRIVQVRHMARQDESE